MHVKDNKDDDWHFMCSELKCFCYSRDKHNNLKLTIWMNGQEIEIENEIEIDKFKVHLREHLNKSGHKEI
jgi:hypothetical protein